MAAWRGGQIERRAPVLQVGDVPALLEEAAAKELLPAGSLDGGLAQADGPGAYGASPGRTGELRDELRVERIDDGRLRVARWILRPNRGWELQEAPVLLPAARFREALAAAAGEGVLASGGAGK
jgi:hypothetical protein